MLDFFLHIKRIYYKLLFDHRICQMKVKTYLITYFDNPKEKELFDQHAVFQN